MITILCRYRRERCLVRCTLYENATKAIIADENMAYVLFVCARMVTRGVFSSGCEV